MSAMWSTVSVECGVTEGEGAEVGVAIPTLKRLIYTIVAQKLRRLKNDVGVR